MNNEMNMNQGMMNNNMGVNPGMANAQMLMNTMNQGMMNNVMGIDPAMMMMMMNQMNNNTGNMNQLALNMIGNIGNINPEFFKNFTNILNNGSNNQSQNHVENNNEDNNQDNISVAFKVNGNTGATSAPLMIQCRADEKVSDIIERYRTKSGDRDPTKNFIFNAKYLVPTMSVGEAGISNNAIIFVAATKGIKGAK